MEITITLDSPRIQEKFDRGGATEIVKLLNEVLGYGQPKANGLIHSRNGDVYDENGNIAGTWEIVRA